MLSNFKSVLAALITIVSFSFAQDVTLTIDGTNLNYDSGADIYGFQFNHDGCAEGAGGGDAEANGFTISTSSGVVLGFSFSGTSIPAGSGTLVELGGDCTTLSGFVFSGEGGSSLTASLGDGGDGGGITCDDENACNYGDDGDCTYAEDNYDCDGNCTAGEDCAGDCGGSALEDECGVCGGDGSSCGSDIAGCTDSSACNYDADATEDDGSCYSDEASCTAAGSANCEAAGGVAEFTAAACVQVATSAEFLASCEETGVFVAIFNACPRP